MNAIYHTPIWKIFAGPGYSHCRYLALIFIPHLLTAVLEGGSFAFIFLAFSAIEGNHTQDTGISSWLDPARWGIHLDSMQLFYFYILAAVGFQAFRGVISFCALYGTSLFSLKVQTIAQKQVYRQIFRFSFPFVSQYKIGDLSEYARVPSAFIPILFESANRLSVSLFMCLGLVSVLYWISPLLTLWTLGLFLSFVFVQKILISKVLRFSLQLTNHLFEFSHETVQSLQGIRPIHIFQKQNYILSKIDAVLEKIVQSSKKAHGWNNIIPTINETINVLLVGAILILGSFLLIQPGQSALPSLLTYIALTYRLATRLQIGMSAVSGISLYYGSIVRLNDLLEDKDKDYDRSGGEELKGWNREIEFRQVTLYYPKSSKPALNQVSFSIAKGSTVAIVGLSGAGKSSILDLILSLQQPSQGEILIDSQKLRSISHESWRRRIGVVSQDTFVFNGTLEENIRFGDLASSGERMKKVIDLAGLSDFVEQLPEGYATVVGERGYKLSGGERQRLALARALLREPEILILDEATSNLDSCAEQLIQASLEDMGADKTLIIVAHRLSTVVQADQIFVLEQGKIVEKGRHAELLVQKGRYAQLWELQSGLSEVPAKSIS